MSTESSTQTYLSAYVPKEMHGRRVIYTDTHDINDVNIFAELERAFNIHLQNRSEIVYLWDYYKGKQPILGRQKVVRPEICNRIVENRANEIVSFKTGYLCGEPIQYVSKNDNPSTFEEIAILNDMMASKNKATIDKEIIEWQMICGTGYRMVLPEKVTFDDDAPFSITTLDPRNTFIVYHSGISKEPIMAVTYTIGAELHELHYCIYTKNHYWEITDGKIIVSTPHALNSLPIFEYPANNARLGSFEIVLPLLDAINNVSSNRIDGVEQFVQAFLKFKNCDISDTDFQNFKDKGAIKVSNGDGVDCDVDYIISELNQDQTQTLVDSLYQTVLTICGIPDRNGNSGGDTGAAVMLRDGWSLAEARAKDSELMFKQAERPMLKLLLSIFREKCNGHLTVKDIKLQFTRRNYENIQLKAQVLDLLLKNEYVHPLTAYTMCGAFSDPEDACRMGLDWNKELMKKAEELANEQTRSNGNTLRSNQ